MDFNESKLLLSKSLKYKKILLISIQFVNSLETLWADFVQTFVRAALTGYLIGCGSAFIIAILIDKSLKRFEYVYGAAGHPNCIFKISYKFINIKIL